MARFSPFLLSGEGERDGREPLLVGNKRNKKKRAPGGADGGALRSGDRAGPALPPEGPSQRGALGLRRAEAGGPEGSGGGQRGVSAAQ